jgi:ATP-dependent DNA helicase PIF1
LLTCTNHVADARNLQELSRLASAHRTYVGTLTGEFRVEKTRLPAPANLEVKVGAQVMFTKNDDRKRWVNGTIGRVVELGAHSVKVALDCASSCETFEVEPVIWEQYRYRYDEATDRIEREVVGQYTQLPLMLAWAVTIHKAQGKTLDRIFVDLGRGAFSPGQVYVALSRVRALKDIRLARPIRSNEVTCDPAVASFYRQLAQLTQDDNCE